MPKAMPLLLAAGALPLAGCHFMASGGAALLGNLFVLAVTVGIFFGTLGLGISAPQRRSGSGPSARPADRSQSEQTRG